LWELIIRQAAFSDRFFHAGFVSKIFHGLSQVLAFFIKFLCKLD